MLYDRTFTQRVVMEKFGTADKFDRPYFMHLVELHVRNDKDLYDRVHSDEQLAPLCRDVMRRVVLKNCVDFDEYPNCTGVVYAGIIAGVGGHSYMAHLTRQVISVLEKERNRDFG